MRKLGSGEVSQRYDVPTQESTLDAAVAAFEALLKWDLSGRTALKSTPENRHPPVVSSRLSPYGRGSKGRTQPFYQR